MRKRSDVIRQLGGRAEENVLRWFGHMKRMKKDQLVKRIVGSDMRGVRLRGRPQTG